MKKKRSVLLATAFSALLLAGSALFAVSSGLFSRTQADEVGTFETTEQHLAPAPAVTPSSTPSSPAPSIRDDQRGEPDNDDGARVHDEGTEDEDSVRVDNEGTEDDDRARVDEGAEDDD